MGNERLSLNDNMQQVVVKMSDGNPGAMDVLLQVLKDKDIDPDNALGGLAPILDLDTMGIYGTDIYILYSDICERDLVKFLAVLRAHQLGFLDGKILKDACHRQDGSGIKMILVDELYKKVKDRLPNFNTSTTVKA